MSDRTTAADTDRVLRDDDRRRELLALEFVRRILDFVKNRVDEIRIVSGRDDLGGCGFTFEIKFEDRIHQLVRRKAVLIELVWCELGGRFLVDDLVRDDLASRRFVDVSGDVPDFSLQNIAEDCESAVRIAVQSALANGELGFVPGGK